MSSGKIPYTFIELAKRDLLPVVNGRGMRQSCYKFNYVNKSHRSPYTPRTHRAYRTRHLHGLTAFYRNRFYEKDRWYKARIEKPFMPPTCYFIDPYKHTRSLSERLAELDVKDPVLNVPVDIGLPLDSQENADDVPDQLIRLRKENQKEMERAARLRKLKIDVDAVERDTRSNVVIGAFMLRRLAEHCGVFRDLFHPVAYFNPVVQLKVYYNDLKNTETLNPVFSGNILAPEETSKQPVIQYEAEPNSYWTLLMTNPDGNLYEDGKEVVHWFVCNIPQNRIQEGEVLVDYMQPLPPKGTGYHRMVFVLFRQDNGRVDLSSFKKSQPCNKLEERTFHTPSFYKKYEDHITPAGLAFFQTSWDESCARCFHQTLKMEIPLYEYEWPKPYLPPQDEIPPAQVSFHQYLDKYRDPRDVEKELLTMRLKQLSPFKNDVADKVAIRRRKYFPNLFHDEDRLTLPSWKHWEKMMENRGVGKYKALYENRLD